MEIPVAQIPPSESEECQKRFQAAVDVIQNLPKNGSYRPSYEVMLRFYSLYKQAVCGPCTASRPSFWDPVGRYKWDAWNRLGDMSRESAMAAYVDEMKKVAQEVIENMPINEKMASFYHYFEPLYHVIHDLPRPPEALLSLGQDINANEATGNPAEGVDGAIQKEIPREPEKEQPLVSVFNDVPQSESADMALSDSLVLTSDSESEVFCDSVEQLDYIKPVAEPYIENNLHVTYTPGLQVTQLGAGQGGEGAGNGPPPRRREQGRDGMRHGWREAPGSVPYSSSRRAGQQATGGGGGHNPARGTEGFQDAQVQEQIMLALQRLKEDMQSVMERLEVVEGLAAALAQNSQWRQMQLTSPQTEVEKWWPFDVSGRTLLLLLIWPFIAQGLIFWLQQRKKKPQKLACP
ncbi:acyl-CoA-binding domain-containing protein 4 isoform X1 [Clarias gariepinus]|uniref:acyl-CoA-binding domain-containing protein 4 isoform X1 n=1 Tax=Clarias gariepinus TaxID=13013 RepID=UPI00234E2FAA|nr:acyl-CoA-binding domain-containing protein 4 isoform X1 [Clarias gariepinus]XP_053368285.1 acyl-CoA-binding domain-containing protein 4 isoform X1 [Clarias gariepinus]